MGFNEVFVLAGCNPTDCATLEELKEVIRDLRTRSRDSALADLGEQRIAAIEILREELGLEPCAR